MKEVLLVQTFFGFGQITIGSAFLEVSLVAQMVKSLETRVQSLGQEDPLKNGMATHSNILSWTISWTEEPGKL